MQLIGSLFGYVLYGAYLLVRNYGLAILLFTIVSKLVLFPSSIKQQKSMANNARLQRQMAELREKYGKNREKLNEETAKLYEKEGVSPYGGCLSTLLPLFIMMGVFYSVAYPLTNTLHLNADMITNAKNVLVSIPGLNISTSATYDGQIDIMKYFNEFPVLQECFKDSSIGVQGISDFCASFNFCGLNLLETPSQKGFSVYLVIPFLCFATSVLSQWVITKLNSNGNAQQGCMKVMMLLLPLFSAYIAYTVPCAVGLYWVFSTILGFIQSLIMHKYFGPDMMVARGEAARIAMLEKEEAIQSKIS